MVVKFWHPRHEPLWSREVKHALVWNYILCSVLCLVSLNMLSKNTHCMSQARFSGLELIFFEILGQFKPSKWPRFPLTNQWKRWSFRKRRMLVTKLEAQKKYQFLEWNLPAEKNALHTQDITKAQNTKDPGTSSMTMDHWFKQVLLICSLL